MHTLGSSFHDVVVKKTPQKKQLNGDRLQMQYQCIILVTLQSPLNYLHASHFKSQAKFNTSFYNSFILPQQASTS